MASLEKAADGNNSPESCPELNDEYFADICSSFNVIDMWSPSDDDSDQVPITEVKTEPKDPAEPSSSSSANTKPTSTSSRQRKESDRSDHTNRDPRVRRESRDKENNRKPKSPENNRRPSPYRGSRFFQPRSKSPPRRPANQYRRPSPLRRNALPSKRPSFYEEITRKLPDLLSSNNVGNNVNNGPNNGMFGYGMNPMMHGQQMMPPHMMQQGGNFMPGPNFIPQHQFPNPQFAPFNQPFQLDHFGNPMMMNQMNVAPLPCPPAVESPILIPHTQSASLKIPEIFDVPVTESAKPRENIQKAKQKAFEEGKISITDYLRQISQQTSKTATAADISAKRAKVQERCKNAATLMDELAANKTHLPFVLRRSEKSLQSMKDDPKFAGRSPLVMSDNNMHFVSQAVKANCREALEANPLRNIPAPLLQLGRNIGMDLVDMSQRIKQKVEVEKAKEAIRTESGHISSINVNSALRTVNRGAQTEAGPCEMCQKHKAKKSDSTSTQTTISAPAEQAEEPGSFKVNLTAETMDVMTGDQQRLLVEFCHAFNIRDERFIIEKPTNWGDESRDRSQDRDELLTYANPENPQVGGSRFIEFSPIRDFAPRSPKRKRITDRLGEKVRSPRHQFYEEDEAGQSRFFKRSPQAIPPYRIPSPLPERVSRDSSNGYRKRSRSNSPKNPHPRRTRSPTVPHSRRGRY